MFKLLVALETPPLRRARKAERSTQLSSKETSQSDAAERYLQAAVTVSLPPYHGFLRFWILRTRACETELRVLRAVQVVLEWVMRDRDVSDLYDKIREAVSFRRKWAERRGFGFALLAVAQT